MALAFFLALILGIINIFVLLKKWTDGELVGVELVAAEIVNLTLIAVATTSHVASARLIASALICGWTLFMATENRIRGALILRDMALTDLDKAREVADQDPGNIGARVIIAKSLYQLGRVDAAIEHMQAAMELEGARYFAQEKSLLEIWQDERDARKGGGEVICPKCGTRNRRGARVCRKCENWLRASDEALDWLRQGGMKTILRGWLVASVCVTLIVFGLSFLSGKGMLVLGLISAAIFLIWVLVHFYLDY